MRKEYSSFNIKMNWSFYYFLNPFNLFFCDMIAAKIGDQLIVVNFLIVST